ncbi:MAG: hypothetical protein KGZ89_04670 [Actinobacteria bacterium]|nr:hypothetical protein [Actinomycetota bacterium]
MFLINKDRFLKFKVLKYFVSKDWYPFIEADIIYKEGISKSRKLITDLDVIAFFPSPFGKLVPIIGDCKTLKNQSPISRALWMRGLMDLLGAHQGLVVLEKSIENDHKLAANQLSVNLISGRDFDIYTKCTSEKYRDINSALCIEEHWSKYFAIPTRFPMLKPALEYTKREFWNEKGANIRLRHILALIKNIKSELNPDNQEHIALFLDLVSFFAIAINEIVYSIFNQYLIPSTKEQLSEELKVLIWGGIENYSYWDELRKMILTQNNITVTSDLSLPEWNRFLQLIRGFLEEPYATTLSPLLLKEVAFEYFADKTVLGSLNNARRLAKSNPQSSKFAILTAEYICKASKAPPEFLDIVRDRIVKLQL